MQSVHRGHVQMIRARAAARPPRECPQGARRARGSFGGRPADGRPADGRTGPSPGSESDERSGALRACPSGRTFGGRPADGRMARGPGGDPRGPARRRSAAESRRGPAAPPRAGCEARERAEGGGGGGEGGGVVGMGGGLRACRRLGSEPIQRLSRVLWGPGR